MADDTLVTGNHNQTLCTATAISPTIKSPGPLEYVYAILFIVIMIIILFGNTLTILAVVKFTALQTVTNLYIISLALADLFVGLCLPIQISIFLNPQWETQFGVCTFKYWSIFYPVGASVCSLLGVAIDRFMAVQAPFHYTKTYTKNRVIVGLVILWIYIGIPSSLIFSVGNRWKPGTLCEIMLVIHPVYFYVVIGGHIWMFLAIITLLYGMLFKTALRHKHQIATITVIHSYPQNQNRKVSNISKDAKAAKSLSLVIGMYAICMLPFTIVMAIEFHIMPNIPPVMHYLQLIATVLVLCNSFMNPIIYASRMRMFRYAYKNLLFSSNRQMEDRLSVTN